LLSPRTPRSPLLTLLPYTTLFRSRDTKSLLLSAGNIVSSLNNHCIVASREFLHKGVCLGKLTYSLHFFIRCVFITPADIVVNCSGKKHIFLKHHGYLVTQCFQVVFSDINTSDF